jgi:hypothetical protein
LHHNFVFSRPLTVTGAFLSEDGTVSLHQMILDKIVNGHFILQNTDFNQGQESEIKISLKKRFYYEYDIFSGYLDARRKDFFCSLDDNEILLTNECHESMNLNEFYLQPEAYSITLTPQPEPEPEPESKSAPVSDDENGDFTDDDEHMDYEEYGRTNVEDYFSRSRTFLATRSEIMSQIMSGNLFDTEYDSDPDTETHLTITFR